MRQPRPGSLNVLKRDGSTVDFDLDKIVVAIKAAFLDPDVLGPDAAGSEMVNASSLEYAKQVLDTFNRRMPTGGSVHIEDIQDQVELVMMRGGEQRLARSYVLFRANKQALRDSKRDPNDIHVDGHSQDKNILKLVDTHGNSIDYSLSQFEALFLPCTIYSELSDSELDSVVDEVVKNSFDGMTRNDFYEAVTMVLTSKIELDPKYSQIAALWLINYKTLQSLCPEDNTKDAFIKGIQYGVEDKRLSERLLAFDLDALGYALNVERNQSFDYLGAKTIFDRYLLKDDNGLIYERPQGFFMRVAMGVALAEKKQDQHAAAIAFYEMLSSFDFMSSTPTLFNAGTVKSQLSSCYLTTLADSLNSIDKSFGDCNQLSKWAGGLGNDWTPLRAAGSLIKGTGGKSNGVVPFLKIADSSTVAINQVGKRKGARCAFLETWHLDIEDFLELRKNTGDDRRRTHDMNTANWVPDLFMKRVFADEQWTLFCPSETSDLHDLFGNDFESQYAFYESEAKAGNLRQHKTVSAKLLWQKMLTMLFETGHPWICFKDPCNIRSPQSHVGVVHSSNLCTEITLNTSDTEIAVCNLGSINAMEHVDANGEINHTKLKHTVSTAMRFLDNVIDMNFYPVEEAKNSNMKHRPVGLGLMGLQDVFHTMGVPFDSEEASNINNALMEAISYYAISASCDLAETRGSYDSFKGSLWSKGILPVDSVELLKASRGKDYFIAPKHESSSTGDWDQLRSRVMKGIRNSNTMAIAPTATIANIVGVSQACEPMFKNLHVKSNMSGEFTVLNKILVERLKALGIWDSAMINDLKYYDGSVQNIKRIPDDLKHVFKTAFELSPQSVVEHAASRQVWLDQSQSINIFIDGANAKKIDTTYRMAWLCGLKTTYYLRTMAATSTEKSTIEDRGLNAVSSQMACSIENGADCEACQ